MLRNILKVFFITLTAVFCSPALAQAKWYSVEYLVFEHAPTGSHQEQNRRGASADSSQALRLLPANGSAAEWSSFRRLRADELSLSGVQRNLSKSVRYTPRLHLGWIQQLASGEQPQPVRVSTGAGQTPIRGSITFRQSRFLHLDIDLTLSENSAPIAVSSVEPASRNRQFRLQQTRRIRTQQLHYFDHPRFGVLVKVMPLSPPVVEAAPTTPPLETDSGVVTDQAPTNSSDTKLPLPAAE